MLRSAACREAEQHLAPHDFKAWQDSQDGRNRLLKDIIAKSDTLLRHLTSVGSHVVVLLVSGGIAFSLPWAARQFLTLWSHVEQQQVLLMSLECTVAAILILLVTFLRRSLKDRRSAKTAAEAGLVSCFHVKDYRIRRMIASHKAQQGLGRPLRIIGFTGFSTFADPKSDLYPIVQNCLEAKVLLANPFSDDMRRHIEQQPDPKTAWNRVRQEVMTSIGLLKTLRATGKPVKLKLYSDPPLVRLAILGEHVWLQCYHTDLEVGTRPEYVFEHDRQEHGLYALWYQYFLKRWTSAELPEYDLDRDELVYREDSASEVRREPFDHDLSSALSRLELTGVGPTSHFSPS